jgi:hypothetical protein
LSYDLTKRQSQLEQTFKNIQKAASNIGGSSEPTPTAVPTIIPYAGYPKSYKDTEIPVEIYQQAGLRYHLENKTEVKEYVINLIHKYYIYKDFLAAEKIPYSAQFPVTFSAIEADVPRMESLVQQNMVTYVDFAFIKARFRYAPEEERIQRLYGDLKVKARAKLEEYRQLFSAENADPAVIIDAANHDIDLITLNNNEGNRIELHYTPDKELFFTDKKFNSFLFAQKQKVVSSIFTLHGVANDEYAYVIVYPIVMQKKQYMNIDELLTDNVSYFKYY